MQFFLTGFMGSGKSTVGRALAGSLGIPFLDLDNAIKTASGQSIPAIFKEKGEAFFRDLEREILQGLNSTSSKVIATGGGTPCYKDNLDWMLENGIVFYLKCDPDLLYQRVSRSPVSERPILQGKNKEELIQFITNRLQQREPFYARAHFIIDGSAPLDSLVKDLAAYCTRFKKGN